MTFFVGQEVVCVDAAPLPGNDIGMDGLRERAIYTIRAVGLAKDGSGDVFLNEIQRQNGTTEYRGRELPFAATRFRPIVEKKAEISFTANAPKDSEKWDNRKRVKVRA